MTANSCCVYLGDKLAAYNFGEKHPSGPQRHSVFEQALLQKELNLRVDILQPVTTDKNTLALFHSPHYIQKRIELSKFGLGYLNNVDTPAFIGMHEAVCYVAGSAIDATDSFMQGDYKAAFIPIAGLHHARRVAYVDIDAHHDDGFVYSFEDDLRLIFVDIHEDGQFLYPGNAATATISTSQNLDRYG